jgi:hypothetical protein
MRSLFFKIFLCFWLSHTLAVVLVYVIMSAREAQRQEPPRRGRFMVLPSRTIALHARTSATVYERGMGKQAPGLTALETYFKGIENKVGVRAALFNARNQQISSHNMPPEAESLAVRAAQSGEMEFMPGRSGLLAARRVEAPSGKSYVMVAEMPRAPWPPWSGRSPSVCRFPDGQAAARRITGAL